MRCIGLDNTRHRCEHDVIDSLGYCEEHRREMQPLYGEDEKMGKAGRGKMFAKIRGSSASRHIASDGAKYDVPAWLKNSDTETVLQHLMSNPYANLRWSAAFVLRKRRDATAIEQLWHVLRTESARLVRQQAVVALGKIGTPAALSPLVETLRHDSDAGVRQACAIALGNLNYAWAASDLVNVLQTEPRAFVRWDCILALGRLGNASVEPLLTELAQTERADSLRRACLEALDAIKQRA